MNTQRKINYVLILFSFFCVAMEAVRMFCSESLCYGFLLWNLLLAWVPYVLSLYIQDRDMKQQKFMGAMLILVWILFLPNGPYIITDLIHLRSREPIPLWYDALVLSTIAWNGLLLTMLAVRNVHGKLQEYYSAVKINIGLVVLFLSAGYGIYLGRFMRWNSWDILYSPMYMIWRSCVELMHPLHHPRPILLSIVFGAILSFTYSIFYLIGHQKNMSNENV